MSKQAFEDAGARGELTTEWNKNNSATKIGAFSAAYSPQNNTFEVTIKTYVEFSDFDQDWDPLERIPWRDCAFAIIEEFWSDRYLIECTRDGWEEHHAVVSVKPQLVANKADGHLHLCVTKAAPAIGTQGGGVGWDTAVAWCGIDDLAAYPKDQKNNREKIFNMRLFQLTSKLDSLGIGVIDCPQNSSDLTPAVKGKLAALGAYMQQISTDDVTGIRISVWGSTGGGDSMFQRGLGTRRATAVANEIKAQLTENLKKMVHAKTSTRQNTLKQAVKTKIGAAGKGVNSTRIQGVVIVIHVPDSVVREAEKDYIVLCHEYGHMLGLPDEYMGVLHPKLTARVNLDSLIPTTVAFATKDGDSTAWLDSDQRRRTQQKGMADLAERQPNILVPPSMDQNQVIDNVQVGSSSIMYSGMQVWPAHYLTLWAALGLCTAKHIDPRHWRIAPSPRNVRSIHYFK